MSAWADAFKIRRRSRLYCARELRGHLLLDILYNRCLLSEHFARWRHLAKLLKSWHKEGRARSAYGLVILKIMTPRINARLLSRVIGAWIGTPRIAAGASPSAEQEHPAGTEAEQERPAEDATVEAEQEDLVKEAAANAVQKRSSAGTITFQSPETPAQETKLARRSSAWADLEDDHSFPHRLNI